MRIRQIVFSFHSYDFNNDSHFDYHWQVHYSKCDCRVWLRSLQETGARWSNERAIESTYNPPVDDRWVPYRAEQLQRVEITRQTNENGCYRAWSMSGSGWRTCLTLYPALALVSMNMTFNSFAFRSPSSVDTCRLSARSVLLPTGGKRSFDGNEPEQKRT